MPAGAIDDRLFLQHLGHGDVGKVRWQHPRRVDGGGIVPAERQRQRDSQLILLQHGGRLCPLDVPRQRRCICGFLAIRVFLEETF